MKSQTVFSILIVSVIMLSSIESRASFSETNPLHVYAIATGGELINSSVKNQTKDMEKTGLLQGAMAAELTQIKKWESKYNSYLKTARGYAEALKAGTTLYAEGVVTLRELHNIVKACKENPQGIGASLAMNNLYCEAATELVKTYRTLKYSIAVGTTANMLTGAERTELMWMLSDNMYALNKKLRQIALSVAYYNMTDVWNHAIAGMVDKTHGQIAAEALDRWKRAQKTYQILNS